MGGGSWGINVLIVQSGVVKKYCRGYSIYFKENGNLLTGRSLNRTVLQGWGGGLAGQFQIAILHLWNT